MGHERAPDELLSVTHLGLTSCRSHSYNGQGDCRMLPKPVLRFDYLPDYTCQLLE